MKRTHIIYCLAIICILLSSCSSTQKLTVKGSPGTEIYSPDMQRLGVIESNGKVKVRISKYEYYAYLMSHQPHSAQFVPFALDYKRTKSHTLIYTGFGLMGAGLATAVGGVCAGDGGEYFAYCGSIAMLAGCAMAVPTGLSNNNMNFKYLSSQTTIQDMSFRPIVDVGYSKSTISEGRNVAIKETGNDTKVTQTTRAKNRKSSTSSRTLKDYGKVLAGTYTGNGSLTRNDDVAEMYDRIHVIIKRISRNTVSIDVMESGEAFFTTGQEYTIRKVGNKFVLSLKGIPSATINIDAQGKLTYYHPKINIDGEIYTLEISANRQ